MVNLVEGTHYRLYFGPQFAWNYDDTTDRPVSIAPRSTALMAGDPAGATPINAALTISRKQGRFQLAHDDDAF